MNIINFILSKMSLLSFSLSANVSSYSLITTYNKTLLQSIILKNVPSLFFLVCQRLFLFTDHHIQ